MKTNQEEIMWLSVDLDGTFLGGTLEDRQQLYQLISAHPDIGLIFVTGRGLESVIPLLSDPTIPQPSFIICDVGCTVVDGKSLQPVIEVQGGIDEIWPGEYAIQEAVENIPGLVRQDVPQERRCSYFAAPDVIEECIAELKKIGESLGCDVLYSANWYLDFLPSDVNKGSTLSALLKHLNIAKEDVMVAGDTLNDLAMFEHDFKGVCVGESEAALLQATEGKARVYHAQAPGAGGIIEAISYFGFLGEEGIDAEARDEVKPGTSDLVIVYHRLPFEEYIENGALKRRNHRSPNGIIPTLASFFKDGKKGAWVAWSIKDESLNKFETHVDVDKEEYPNLVAARVALTKNEVDIFYKRFSKEAFWPTLHTFWERATYNDDHWQVFCKVNRKFAEQTAAEASEGATVWLHDYNLWMVPAYLRELRPDLNIAFFHHTYFPSADVFNVLPWRKEIIGSLLQCDYIGFHIPRQSENFIDVAKGVMPFDVVERTGCAPRFLTYGCAVGLDEMTTEIRMADRTIRLGAHPVGLDLNRVQSALENPLIQERMTELRNELQNVKMMLSVERLDYTKGILAKLEAYEKLLEAHPELHGKVTLVTICVPAAKEMTVYDELQSEIEQAVGRINGRYAQVGWTPLQFFFRAVPFEQLVAYYAIADLMWISPLRDGLNLVAKEYIATQGMTDGAGVLVLSEFAGAAAEIKGAVLCNPHDPAEMSDTCYFALCMHRKDAKARINEAYEGVSYYDLAYWGDDFLKAVSKTADKNAKGQLSLAKIA
ncbi:glucosylglycerol-phosphate synthase [Amphritea sp. 1_MG-2023]|uniref:glucosylglycerol-phosphate synthase n=1 Tax=Amphritea sp. 1_MG-2023 TaxID=3062670 RepID=UPI0026E27776|nr:glucosylglycerol-phosphate synthase [Amphritea sp. 1_MG-2023]MDO6563686.1 glucosylglycerol-phosphate synthase [Amphritea sp. 1_MG-2023]